jgi:2-dehydro-3-deoxygluconokinase
VSGDINYRRNLWQYGKSARDIMPALIELTQVMIAGITDLENCLGISGTRPLRKPAEQTSKKYPGIQRIATTERESISSSHNKIRAVLYDEKKLYHSKVYDLTHIVDRVGSGDAFMAGLIFGMLSGKDDQQALEFATAACAWKHSVEGDVNLASSEEIEGLVKGENVGKLLR